MTIYEYGWNSYFEEEWKKMQADKIQDKKMYHENMYPARIVADYGQMLRVIGDKGEFSVNRPIQKGTVSMQLAVGDWIGLEDTSPADMPLVRLVLPRRTKFSRAAAGIEAKEQIVAANVDTVFLVQSLNRDFNMKRLERYLIAAWDSGAMPVVVLTKADCCQNVVKLKATAAAAAPGVDIISISSVTGEGMEELKKYLLPGKTVALLGSSGVGKSTLINTLVGRELLKTQEIRQDDSRGRHTTTHRELVLLPDGGLVMDTPGMRTLALWDTDKGMEVMFGDVEELITRCRFHDCTHGNEPGCAVRQALETGSLDSARWESWLKLQKELQHLEAKKEGTLRLKEKQWGKQISKLQKEFYKGRN